MVPVVRDVESSRPSYLAMLVERSILDLVSGLNLTEKEVHMLEQLSIGKRDHEIAAIEGVQKHTISSRLERICNKLNASTRCEAVAVYVRKLNSL